MSCRPRHLFVDKAKSNLMSSQLSATPLHAWHQAHGARMAEFANYEMPIQYGGIVAEHVATRTALVFSIFRTWDDCDSMARGPISCSIIF